MEPVAVVGHLCLDLRPGLAGTPGLTPGGLVDIGPLEVELGGSVANTGRVLAALGVPVTGHAALGPDDLATIAARVNDLLAADLTEDRFVTAFVGILDPRKHECRYISGGQGPLLLISADGADARPANAVPFAVMPGIEYPEIGVFEMRPGSTLALLTDGFYEAIVRTLAENR